MRWQSTQPSWELLSLKGAELSLHSLLFGFNGNRTSLSILYSIWAVRRAKSASLRLSSSPRQRGGLCEEREVMSSLCVVLAVSSFGEQNTDLLVPGLDSFDLHLGLKALKLLTWENSILILTLFVCICMTGDTPPAAKKEDAGDVLLTGNIYSTLNSGRMHSAGQSHWRQSFLG